MIYFYFAVSLCSPPHFNSGARSFLLQCSLISPELVRSADPGMSEEDVPVQIRQRHAEMCKFWLENGTSHCLIFNHYILYILVYYFYFKISLVHQSTDFPSAVRRFDTDGDDGKFDLQDLAIISVNLAGIVKSIAVRS